MRLLTRVIAITCLLTGMLSAQDAQKIVGQWAASADWTDEAGGKHQEKSTIEIRNEDGKLTGNICKC